MGNKKYKIGRLTFHQWPYQISDIVINDQDQIQISPECIFPKSYGFSFKHELFGADSDTEVLVHHQSYKHKWKRNWEVLKLICKIWRHQRTATHKRYPTITYRRHTQPSQVFCGNGSYIHAKSVKPF